MTQFKASILRPYAQRRLPKPGCTVTRPRLLSIWTLPKLVLATTSKRNRRLAMGALGAVSVISSMVGPGVWLAVGGVGTVMGWRLYKKAERWWQYLPFDTLLGKIGTHTASEKVREAAIQRLSSYFQHTAEGAQMLKTLGLDSSLVWKEVYKSEVTRTEDAHHVSVRFWLSDTTSQDPQGGSCQATCTATVSHQGQITLQSILLDAPGWHRQASVPVQA
ncbi:hypothetical protein BY458DRAFT_518863 [Sporodiniella umbellata]|nr:hypothetical protein BY458DRAFT_518863 [Sporodiniella umbellata]